MNLHLCRFRAVTLLFILMIGLIVMAEHGLGQVEPLRENNDFGDVHTSEFAMRTLGIRNRGDRSVEIVKVTPSCSCIEVRCRKSMLVGGETCEVDLTIHGTEQTGTTKQVVVVSWRHQGETNQNTTELAFQFRSLHAVALAPSSIDFGVIRDDEKKVGRITVKRNGAYAAAWTCFNIEMNPYFNAVVENVSANEWTIEVSPKVVSFPQEKISQQLRIRFFYNGDALPITEAIPISIQIQRPLLRSSISSIFCADINRNNGWNGQLYLDGELAPKATVSSRSSWIKFSSKVIDEKCLSCTMEINEKNLPSSLAGTILIDSEGLIHPIEVPIVAFVE